MGPSLLIFYLLHQQASLVVSESFGVNIQLYKNQNFTGLVWETNCNNIPRNKISNVFSMRTNTCFIGYMDPDCKSSRTTKYMPGDIKLKWNQLGWNGPLESFHTCNEKEGGNQLNVDLTEYFPYGTVASPVVLESYRNVCSCINVPQYVQSMDEWSVDNHHNDLLAYYEPDCSVIKWNPEFISAGHSDYSRMMYYPTKTDIITNITYKIQSLGPDPNSAYFQMSCNSSHVTTEITNVGESTTESVADTEADLRKRFEGLTIQIGELQTQVDQLKENFEFGMKQQFDKLAKRNTEVLLECSESQQLLSDKVQKLEANFENKMKKQNEEFLEVIARLRAFLHGKL